MLDGATRREAPLSPSVRFAKMHTYRGDPVYFLDRHSVILTHAARNIVI